MLGEHWQDRGGSGVGLYRVTLPAGNTELVHSGRGTHSAGSENERGWWLSQLLGPTCDEKGLLVSLATSFREAGVSRVEYTVCAFDLVTGEPARARQVARSVCLTARHPLTKGGVVIAVVSNTDYR